MVRLRFAGPTRAVRRGSSDVGGSFRGVSFVERGIDVSAEGGAATNSVKDGPALRRSRNVVGRRRVEGLCSGASVANARERGWGAVDGGRLGEE